MQLAIQIVNRYRDIHTKASVYLRDIILLIIRAHWGYAFFLAGLGKFRNFERTAKFFDSLGIPLPELNAYLAAGTEMFGGLFLLLGLGSRLVPLPLIFTMAVAYGTAHTKELSALLSYPDSDAFFEAAPFLFLFAALLVFAFGPGRFSLDHALTKYSNRK